MSVLPALRPAGAVRLACLALASTIVALARDVRAQDTVTTVVLAQSSLPVRSASDTVGADVAIIYPDSLPDMPRTMSELLAARVAGLFVQRSTGAAGASSWISMRDAGAVHALEPLVVVDGVRRASTPPSINYFSTPSNTLIGERLLPSALDDIPVDQVERVEILRGPAAAARYGRDARYGVIVVTTRRPLGGRPELRASLTGGLGSERADFPINHASLDATGNPCTSAAAVNGYCTRAATSSYSVLRDRNPFESGSRRGARLDATAGLGIASFAFGATHDRTDGVLPMDGADHTAVTARALVPLGSRVRLSASAQTSVRGISQPAQGSSTLEIISGGIYGRAIDCSTATPCGTDSISHGYRSGTPGYLTTLGARRRLQHFSEGAVLDMRATSWLTSQSSVSVDGFANHGKRFDGERPGSSIPSVFRQEIVSRAVRATLEQSLRATWTAAALQGATMVAVRSDRDRSHETTAAVSTAIFNGNISTSGQWGGSSMRDRRTTARLEQRLSAGERVSGGAGVLWTHYKSNGSLAPRPTLDGFADASVLLVDPVAATGVIRSLRLRAAAGQISGYDPRVLARLAFVPIYVPPTPYPTAVRPLRAERAFELEGGVDATFAPANLHLALTAYRRNDTDPYEVGPVIPSTGFAVAGDLRRRLTGVELSAGMTVVDVDRLRWTMRSHVALSGDRITRWRWPQLWIGGGTGAYTVIEKGRSFGAWGSTPLTFADTNGNGVIEPQELSDPFASSQLPHAGHSRPTRTAGLQSSMLVRHAFTIGAQLDYAGGHRIINTAAVAQCLVRACAAVNEPSAPLVDQARAVAAQSGWINGYLESGSTVRLRELSISVESSRMASVARSGSLRFTLAGRNLATWSRYHGLDSDVDVAAPGVSSPAIGFLPGLYLPSTRQLTARLTLTY